jgi:hypothetical protein
METEMLMEGLSKEINTALRSMAKASTVEEKMAYSQIIKNLCESLDVFLNLATNIMNYDTDDFDD